MRNSPTHLKSESFWLIILGQRVLLAFILAYIRIAGPSDLKVYSSHMRHTLRRLRPDISFVKNAPTHPQPTAHPHVLKLQLSICSSLSLASRRREDDQKKPATASAGHHFPFLPSPLSLRAVKPHHHHHHCHIHHRIGNCHKVMRRHLICNCLKLSSIGPQSP